MSAHVDENDSHSVLGSWRYNYRLQLGGNVCHYRGREIEGDWRELFQRPGRTHQLSNNVVRSKHIQILTKNFRQETFAVISSLCAFDEP